MRRRNFLPLLVPVVLVATVGLGAVVQSLTKDGEFQTGGPSGPVAERRIGSASFDAAFRTGIDLLRQGRADDAAHAFGEAVRLNPNRPEAHANLGFAALALGRNDAAEQAFLAAIDLRRGQTNAYFGLAEALERKGDLAGALGAMRSYVHLVPESDPFRRRALSAIWEWESALSKGATSGGPAAPPVASQRRGRSLFDSLAALGLVDVVRGRADFGRYAGRPLVLNIWATWCAPCRREMPSLQRLSARLDHRRIAVIGISVDDDVDFVREFLNDSGITFPNYLDRRGGRVAGLLGIRSYPQTFLIGADGRIEARIEGSRDWDRVNEKTLFDTGGVVTRNEPHDNSDSGGE